VLGLRGQATPAHVFYTLAQLEKRGYLAEADDPRPAAESALWAEQQVDSASAARRLAGTPVTVRAVGAVDVAPLRALLRSIEVRTDGEQVLTVVATDGYLRRDLRACNEEDLQHGRPRLLVKPVGRWVWFGPLFVPGKTGCWPCVSRPMPRCWPTWSRNAATRERPAPTVPPRRPPCKRPGP
jgi:oxazoline/thiazoline synthase